jgi:hypothetical protein
MFYLRILIIEVKKILKFYLKNGKFLKKKIFLVI